MKNTIAILTLLPLILSGCISDRSKQFDIVTNAVFGGSSNISKKQIEEVERGEASLVISRCTAITPPVGIVFKNHSPISCITRWGGDEGAAEGLITIFSSVKFQPISIVTLRPGRYSLTYFRADNNDFWNTDASSSYLVTDITDIASFNVQGGEVLYIGDLEFDIRNINNKSFLAATEPNTRSAALIAQGISVHDDIEPVKQMLSKRYPKLLDKLQTRLIQLSPKVIEAQRAK